MPAPTSDAARARLRWLRYMLASLIVMAVGAYIYATLGGWIIESRRLDANSIVLIVLAAGAAFLIANPSSIEGLTSITLGSFKAEFAQIRRRQEDQQRQVESISAVLALLLTDAEQVQLLTLGRGESTTCKGSHEIRARLRKLRDMRLIQMNRDQEGNSRTVAAMTDDKVVDLSDFLSLTRLGRQIVAELERIQLDRLQARDRDAPAGSR